MFDYTELRWEIDKTGMTFVQFAWEVGVCTQTLYYKMRGRSPFKDYEMKAIMEMLGKSVNDIPRYFFKEKEDD